MTLLSTRRAGSVWPESMKSLSGTVVIAVFVVTFVVQAFQIPSESMENTLLIGDYLLVDKLHFGTNDFGDKIIPYRQVRRGDIVVFHYPVDPSVHFVKLVVDNQLIVPEGNYFVMGDNRDDSLDSRYWGFVPRENIVGRPLLIYWSMRKPEPPRGQLTASDKLKRFLYAMNHILQITRWDR